jgi:hypothetical protein
MEMFMIVLFTSIIAIILLAYGIFQVHKRRELPKKMEEEKAKRQVEEETRRQAAEEGALLLAEEEARRKVQEDAIRQAEEEKQRKAIVEHARQLAEEEAQCKVEEEAKRQADEEQRKEAEEDARLRAEEEIQRKAEEDARRKSEEAELPTISLIHKIAPEDRGGKPRDSSEEKDDTEKTEILVRALKTKMPSLRPEVVCWKDKRKWFIGLEIQEEYQEFGGIIVTQDGIRIQKDDRGRWVLLQTTGIVQVSWEEIGYQKEIRLDKPYLVFRLAGQKVNRGSRVGYATFGSYLVIVPDQWKRDEDISGPTRLSPEPVCIDRHQAHYFLLERGCESKICFRTSTGEPITVPTRAPRFELIGNQLSSDASENVGPLFAEHPPIIKAIDQNIWRSIKTIVVGQEGSGRKRWRTHFAPRVDRNEQIFPDELNRQQGGWYFVRFYDLEDTLVESMDFRFINALKEIIVQSHSCLPSSDGHSSVSIEFFHDSGCAIRLAEGDEDILQVQHTGSKTIAIIPPNTVWDRTRWSINIDNRPCTDTVILVERVWWALGDEDVAKVQPHWSDKPLIVPRDCFSATSKHILWLRLPRERWIETILGGFTKPSESFRVEVTKKHIALPLSKFVDAQELEDKFSEHSLNLWITCKDQTVLYAPVIKILPDKPLPQIIEKPPVIDTRPAPVPLEKSFIPKTPDFLNLPVDRKCCSTCSFATINELGIICAVGTWEERIDRTTFCYQFALHICSRWQGEYKGPDGAMTSG